MGGKRRQQQLPAELADGVWPVRSLDGFPPVISDGFQRPGPGAKRGGKGHLGHDVMFRRPEKGAFDRPDYTPHFFCPSGKAEAINVVKGIVGIVKQSLTQGWWVEVKHGRYMSVHRHLAHVCVEGGELIEAGHTLGIVGHAPRAGKKGINHDHWEMWDMLRPGPRRRAYKIIDASRFLRRWKKLS